MKGKLFLDTNVLVYAYSADEPIKRFKCLELIKEYQSKNQLVWSTQVMQEFYVVLTKKFGIEQLKARGILENFSSIELVVNDFNTILEGINLQVLYGYSFWDGMIISAAIQSNCSYLISEDMQHAHQIGKLKIMNPFED